MSDRARNARLACPGVGTLDLPWWPDDVMRTGRGLVWSTVDRPGRTPLLLAQGRGLEEYRVGYHAQDQVRGRSAAAHLGLLDRVANAVTPVNLWLGSTNRGAFQLTDLSVVELEWTATGSPDEADVTFTLRRASTITLRVGPVPPRRNPNPHQAPR